MAFTVSMPQPSTHALHMTSPGYYGVVDYSRNVSNFRLTDGAGRALRWEKVSKNTRVAAGNAPSIVLDYDVCGATPSRPILIWQRPGLPVAIGRVCPRGGDDAAS